MAGAIWSDNFESDAVGSAPAGWTSTGTNSTWNVQANGSRVLSHTGWTGSITAGSASWSNYSLSVSVNPSCWASEYDGLMFAAAENGHYSLYIVGGTQLVLGKWVKGTWTKLASAPFAFVPSRWYTVSVYLPGGTISAYVNGTLVLQAADSTFSAGGVGLDSNDPVAFDNVVVAPIGLTSAPSSSPSPRP